MFSLNEIIYTLSPTQDKIIMEEKYKINDSNCHDSLYNRYVLSKKFDTRDLFICISEIIGDSFYIYKSCFKDSFIESILNILSDKFILSDKKVKKNCINLFRQTIGYDLNDKNLYYKFGYNKIFLCTEDLNFFNSMKKNFKTNLFYFNSFRSKKDDAFKIYPRNKHRFKLGLEILLEALIISKCQGFLHAVTNVSMYVKYLDQNNYIKYFKLDSGTNTSNEFLAPYMWFYKSFAPRIMGGFKKKIF